MENTAILSNKGDYTSFTFNGTVIRFVTPSSLVRYTSVKKWKDGYIEVGTDYGEGEVEEYIDLRPILDNLFIDSVEFLSPIRSVEVKYA